jgi:hypothetical protein
MGDKTAVSLFVRSIACAIFLLSGTAALQAGPAAPEGRMVYLGAGTGMPGILNGSVILRTGGGLYYVQLGGGTFFIGNGYRAGVTGGFSWKNFGLHNSLVFVGGGYTYLQLHDFSLSSGTHPRDRDESRHCLNLGINYAKFWNDQLGWIAGFDINGSTSGIIPELRFGVIAGIL